METRRQNPDLAGQLDKASMYLSASLVPPGETSTSILDQPLSYIKENYSVRYGIYLELIKAGGAGVSPERLLEMERTLTILNNLGDFIKQQEEVSQPSWSLRPPQVTAFKALVSDLEKGYFEGFMKIPTGGGKTVIFTKFLEAILKSETRDKHGLKALVVVPKKDLVDQTVGKFETFAEDLEVGRVYQKAKEYGKTVTVITYDSLLLNLASGKINPEEFDLLILDEAHRGLSKARIDAIKRFTKAIKIGFTATPKFSEEKQVSIILPRKYYDLSLTEAIDLEMIAGFESVFAYTNVDLTHIKTRTNEDGDEDYDLQELEEKVNIPARNQAAVELYKAKYLGRPALVNCISVAHAKAQAAMFEKNGIPAHAVWGEDCPDRDNFIGEFDNRAVNVLCSVDLLTEGSDFPHAEVCINLRPTRSWVVAEQRGGRVLRLYEEKPEKIGIIIDFIDKDVEERVPITFAHVAGIAAYPGKLATKIRESLSSGEEKDGVKEDEVFEIEGLRVVTSEELIMQYINETSAFLDPKVNLPEGWMSENMIARAAGVPKDWVTKRIWDVRREDKEAIRVIEISKRRITFLNPEVSQNLIQALTESKLPWPPEGAININRIDEMLNIPAYLANRLAKELRKENPEVCGVYRATTQELRAIYLLPEGVKILSEQAQQYMLPADFRPTNWLVTEEILTTLARRTGLNRTFMRKSVNTALFKIVEDDLGAIKYGSYGGKKIPIYRPEIVDQVMARLGYTDKVVPNTSTVDSKKPRVPKDWQNADVLEKSYKFKPETVSAILDKVKSDPKFSQHHVVLEGQEGEDVFLSVPLIQQIVKQVRGR